MDLQWHRARLLAERSPGDPGSPAAAERLAEWQSTTRLDDQALRRRLSAEGLDRDQFLSLLAGAPPLEVDPPGWWGQLQRLLSAWAPPEAEVGPNLGAAMAPFVRDILQRLAAQVPQTGSPALAWPRLLPMLAADLTEKLLGLARRTLLLDLHVCRLQGRLRGDDPTARFADYVRLLLASPAEWERLLGEYPVLARLLASTMEDLLAHHLALLSRLRQDWDSLRGSVLPADAAEWLLEIRDARSDPHHGGQTVALLALGPAPSAPPTHRLVYKPRSLGPEVGFAELVAWLNAHLPPELPALAAATALDRGSYGWMEHVLASPCADRDEVARFYRRQGMFLALLHAIRASDLHEENLIAAGEHPVYVDLEALFRRSPSRPAPAHAREAAERWLAESVLSVGLLPFRVGGPGGVNPAGLGDGQVQQTARPAPVVLGAGTDQMRMGQQTVTLPVGENVARLGQVAQSVGDWADELESGFLAVRSVLARHREALLADDGPLQRLSQVQVRHLVRPTSLYASILRDGTHPDNLSDALDRERLVDILWSVGTEDASLWRLVPAERAELLRGDVPRFTTLPASRDLWSGHGQRWPDHFPDDALSAARQGLLALGPEEDERQRLVLRAALDLAVKVAPRKSARASASQKPLDLAREIGETLACHAVLHGDQATWLGLTVRADETSELAPVGPDLYAGDAGIALFLAWLGELSGEERFAALARAAWRSAVACPSAPGPIGAYEGALSIRYAGTLLERLWGEPMPGPTLEAVVEGCQAAVEQDRAFDLLSGSAGAIAVLLAIGADQPAALALADRCGEHLLATAIEPCSGEAAWPRPRGGEPLLGLSHGVAGIACALLLLARAGRPGADALRDLALRALRYERTRYQPARRNWPDLRADGPEPRFMSAWCHGAPGIVLSRALVLDQLDDEAHDEIAAGVSTTLASIRGAGHSLCHGDVGNLLIVDRIARRLGRQDWLDAARSRQGELLAALSSGPARCGLGEPAATPGLMAGIAGVGLGLLALAAPERVPFVLAPGG